jgi:uncharacterized protein
MRWSARFYCERISYGYDWRKTRSAHGRYHCSWRINSIGVANSYDWRIKQTEMSKKHKDSFLGSGWSFPPEFSYDMGRIVMVSDEQDIWESLQIILSTAPGERVLFPMFGCGIRKKVFETVNHTFINELREIIRVAILQYEPRIILNEITVERSDNESGLLRIKLDYTIRITNSRSNMVYPFYLREGTNIPSEFLTNSKA